MSTVETLQQSITVHDADTSDLAEQENGTEILPNPSAELYDGVTVCLPENQGYAYIRVESDEKERPMFLMTAHRETSVAFGGLYRVLGKDGQLADKVIMPKKGGGTPEKWKIALQDPSSIEQ